jgi:hypothetical protein
MSAGRSREHAAGTGPVLPPAAGPVVLPAAGPPAGAGPGTGLAMPGAPGELPQPASAVTSRPAANAAAAAAGRRMVMGLTRTP